MSKNTEPLTEQAVIDSINAEKSKARKARGFGVKDSLIAGSIRITDSVATPEKPAEEPEEIPAETEPEKTEEAKSSLNSLTPEALTAILKNAISPLQEQLNSVQSQNAELQSSLQSAKAELDATKAQLDQAAKEAQVLNDLGKLIGSPVTKKAEVPMFNVQTSVNNEPKGLANEFLGLFNSVQTVRNVQGAGATTGVVYANQRDHKPLAKFIQDHFAEERVKGRSWRSSSLIKDLESYFKGEGMLGGISKNATSGSTTGNTAIPNFFLDVLSALMRETHTSTNVFWQFVTTVYDPTSAPSKNILVPRFEYIDEPTSIADYLIANTTTFNPINLTVGSGSDSQAITASTVPIGIAQYGLGRGTSTATRPVFIPEFHEAQSLVDLMGAVDSRLMQHYYRFEELLIRLQFEASTKVLYNNGGAVTTSATDLDTGDDGTFTKEYADMLYSYMFENKVPALPNGKYILVLNPTSAAHYKQSLGDQYRPVTEDQMMEVTNTFRMATGVEIGRVSGYLGSYNNFEVFASNSFGVGAAGSTATVNSVALGGSLGNVDMVDNFAFGIAPVGRGIALPMELRSQGSPFDLGTAFIWVSREGVGAMDVDAALDSAQQTRVYKIRCTRTPV